MSGGDNQCNNTDCLLEQQPHRIAAPQLKAVLSGEYHCQCQQGFLALPRVLTCPSR